MSTLKMLVEVGGECYQLVSNHSDDHISMPRKGAPKKAYPLLLPERADCYLLDFLRMPYHWIDWTASIFTNALVSRHDHHSLM